MSFNNSSSKRIGLVLAGGGAKGAYQFGVVDELVKNGVRFSAASGTSVGGLNAVLVSLQRLDFGRRFWSDISLHRVFKPKLHWVVTATLFFLRLILAYGDGLLPVRKQQRIDTVLRGILCGVLIAGVILTVLLLPRMLAQDPTNTAAPIIGICVFFAAASGFISAMGIVIGPRVLPMLLPLCAAGIMIVVPGVLFGMGIVALPIAAGYWDYPPSMWHFLVAFSISLGFIHLTKGRIADRFLMPWWDKLESSAGLDPIPIRQALEGELANGVFQIPTYVCVASRQWREDTEREKLAFPWCIVPHYLRVDLLGPKDRLDALIATAALPLGIVPCQRMSAAPHPWFPRDKHEISFIDGGAADNEPLLPLLAMENCDEVIIVRLEPRLTFGKAEETGRLLALIRARLLPSDIVPPTWARDEVRIEDGKNICLVPRIHVIAPKESLGGFLGGTMNFDRKYCAGLVTKGREDARAFLGRNPSAVAPSAS